MNDLKLIMEGWRGYLVKEHIKSNLMENYSYVTEVLGVDLPLNENGEVLPLTEEMKNKIIEEQMLFEGFWSTIIDKVKDTAGDVKAKLISTAEGVKAFGKAGWRIISSMYAAARNPELVGKFTATVGKKLWQDLAGAKGIRKVLQDLKTRIPKLNMPTLSSLVEKALQVFNSTWEKIKSLSGWKQLIGVSGFSIAAKWLFRKVQGFVEPYLEIIKTKPDDQIADWLKDNLKSNLIDTIKGAFPNITEKLVSVASGVKPWWDAIVGAVGSMKLVIDALGVAASRFARYNLGVGGISI